MSFSNTFSDPFWTVVTLAVMPISVIFLYKALKGGIPTGPAYAVWVGIGAIGAVIVSILMGDVPNLMGFIFLFVLIAGVIGLNLVSERSRWPGLRCATFFILYLLVRAEDTNDT
jgi:quaternary ammonium compound-resistance protein SugE